MIQPLNFGNAQECEVRGGLPNFFEKAAAGKTVTIGYIGGSITQAVHGYRASSARFIQSMFPRTPMRKPSMQGCLVLAPTWAPAGLREQLLQYRPDPGIHRVCCKWGLQGWLGRQLIRQIWKE